MNTTNPDVAHTASGESKTRKDNSPLDRGEENSVTAFEFNQPRRRQWDDDNLPELMTRPQLCTFLTERGFPLKLQTLARLCMENQGPPSAGRWGQREMHAPLPALEWARARVARTLQPASAA